MATFSPRTNVETLSSRKPFLPCKRAPRKPSSSSSSRHAAGMVPDLPTSSAPGRGLALRYALGVLGLCPSGRCSRHLSTHFDGSARSLVCRRHFSSKSAAAAFFFNAAHLHDFGYHETEHGYHCIMSSTEVPVRNIGILTTGRGRTFTGSCAQACTCGACPPPIPPDIERNPRQRPALALLADHPLNARSHTSSSETATYFLERWSPSCP